MEEFDANANDSSDNEDIDDPVGEVILASIITPRPNSDLNEDITNICAQPSDSYVRKQHQNNGWVGRAVGFPVTAMAHTRGRLLVGFDDGRVMLFKSRNLNLVVEYPVSDHRINNIFSEYDEFYIVSGPIVWQADCRALEGITQLQFNANITGFLRGEEHDYFVDCDGRLYLNPGHFYTDPGSVHQLNPMAYLTGINNTFCQLQIYANSEDVVPVTRVLAFVAYRALCGVIEFTDDEPNNSHVIRTNLFCHDDRGDITVKVYDKYMYFMNVKANDDMSQRQLTRRPINQMYDDWNTQLIVSDVYPIKSFMIQNNKLCLILSSNVIDIFAVDTLIKINRIVVNSEVTLVTAINHQLIIGLSGGDVISLRITKRNAICGNCFLLFGQNEGANLWCSHNFAERQLI